MSYLIKKQKNIDKSVNDINSEDINDTDSEDEDISNTNSENKSIYNTDSKDEDISDSDNNDKIKELIVNNEGETKESIIYDVFKKVGNVLEKSTINNNEELINNTLKTINTLGTNISLKEQSKIASNFEK